MRPTAIKGTMNHEKTSFSKEVLAGEIIVVVQHLAPLRYVKSCLKTHKYPAKVS
jgi:hypothetical protein